MRYVFTLLLAMFSQSTFAAGPWDGIYKMSTEQYLSVHQNGSSIIVGMFSTFPPLGAIVNLGAGQRFYPLRSDVWDLFTGEISGSSVELKGEQAYGACFASISVNFYAGGAEATRNYSVNTPAGTSQNVNCHAAFEAQFYNGRNFTAVKVY